MKFNRLLLIAAVVFFSTNFSFAQDFREDTYYRLTTKWQGEGMSLDIINDGKNNQPILAKTGNYTGQMWKIKKTGKGIYTLTTKWQGPQKKLDCIQGAKQNYPVLNESTYSGSAWKIVPIGKGYYKITNMWLSDRSLDIVNDGKNNKIQVAKTGNYTGQMWKITDLNPPAALAKKGTALPAKFNVRAFSVNGKGTVGKPAYWFALKNKDSRGRILNDNQLKSGATKIEIETINLEGGQVALKVLGQGADMYLTARGNKQVHVDKAEGGKIPAGAKFKTVKALTSAEGAEKLNYRSFESALFKGHYLRHAGYIMHVHPSENKELFRQDASWLIMKK